jgi:hypothetical protein
MINVLTDINKLDDVNVEDIVKEVVKVKNKFKDEILKIIYDNKKFENKNIHNHNLIET